MSAAEEEYEKHAHYVAKRREYLAAHVTDEFIGYLKEHFETDLPCFQGKAGSFDPLDAMRRDAYREVVLWLEGEKRKHKEQTTKEKTT